MANNLSALVGNLDGWQRNQEFSCSRVPTTPSTLLTEEGYKSALQRNLSRHIIRPLQLLCNHSAASITRTSYSNESLCISASANLCLPFFREELQQEQFLVSNERIAVHILRFVNGVPLLERGDDAMSCLVTRVVRSMNWSNYGYRMRLIPEEDLTRMYHSNSSSSSSSISEPLLVAPVWELQYSRGGGEVSVAAPGAPQEVREDSADAMEEDHGPPADADEDHGIAERAVVGPSGEAAAESRRFASLVLTVDVCGHNSESQR